MSRLDDHAIHRLPAVALRGAPDIREPVWLLGQPPLTDYLDHVERFVEGGGRMDRRALVDAWRVANDCYYEVERTEAAIVDEAECLDLPDALLPLAEDLARISSSRRTFDHMPTTFGMVEFEKIVVSQRRATLPSVGGLQARFGSK